MLASVFPQILRTRLERTGRNQRTPNTMDEDEYLSLCIVRWHRVVIWRDFELKISWGQPRAGSSPAPSIFIVEDRCSKRRRKNKKGFCKTRAKIPTKEEFSREFCKKFKKKRGCAFFEPKYVKNPFQLVGSRRDRTLNPPQTFNFSFSSLWRLCNQSHELIGC